MGSVEKTSMETLIAVFNNLDQDSAIVALFALLLIACAGCAVAVALLRSLGRWGRVALFAGAAIVAAVWVLR